MRMVRTREGNIQVQAEMANRSWAWQVSQYFAMLVSAEVMTTLKLTREFKHDPGQQDRAEQFYRLLVSGACFTAWTLSFDSELPPNNWYGILDKSPVEAQLCRERIRWHKENVASALLCRNDLGLPSKRIQDITRVQWPQGALSQG